MGRLRLIRDFDLRHHNTLGLDARSRLGAVITDPEMLPELFEAADAEGLPVRILGSGSNVVLSPGFDGITALMATRGRQLLAGQGDMAVAEAAAGEAWDDFVAWSVAQGAGGLENLAGIPGTAGAAPIQNIGAYGVELADRFDSLVAFDTATRSPRTFGRNECRFGYRDSLFKHERGRYVVLSVRVALPRPWVPVLAYPGLSDLQTPDAAAVMETVLALRRSKLPDWRLSPNAGSFFHNPVVSAQTAAAIARAYPGAPAFPRADGSVKLSAAWLIDQSGLKGFRLGPVGVSERHALVVVNHDGGAQADIVELATRIKAEVRSRFGIDLAEEPEFL